MRLPRQATAAVLVSLLATITVFCASALEDGKCTKKEWKNVTVVESYLNQSQRLTYVWCLSVNFRCPRYKLVQETAFRNVTQRTEVDVEVCCQGFARMADGQCHSICPCFHGVCVSVDKCVCHPGFGGPACNISCPDGKWGRHNCNETCTCRNGAKCDPDDGHCMCAPGWQGIDCSQTCPPGKYGEDCRETCNCQHGATCNHVSGVCTCLSGYKGRLCEESCPNNSYGEGCTFRCACQNGGRCNPVTGRCSCVPGWMGDTCHTICPPGSHGFNCLETCACSANSATCNPRTGECRCKTGYRGVTCHERVCPSGTSGPDCDPVCDCSGHGSCRLASTGGNVCHCDPGYAGVKCNDVVVVAPVTDRASAAAAPTTATTTDDGGGVAVGHRKGAAEDDGSSLVGIIVGVVLLLSAVAAGVGIYLFYRHKKRKQELSVIRFSVTQSDAAVAVTHPNPAYSFDRLPLTQHRESITSIKCADDDFNDLLWNAPSDDQHHDCNDIHAEVKRSSGGQQQQTGGGPSSDVYDRLQHLRPSAQKNNYQRMNSST